MIKVQALLIAAGDSQRMGIHKQLLPWGEKTLIEHQIDVLQDANLSVSVVLGANADVISKKIANLEIRIFENQNWPKGMGTSIACGIKGVDMTEVVDNGILIAMVDQPLISSNHFHQMIMAFEPGKNQIISSENSTGIKMPPVLFDKYYLDELMDLEGDFGAKQIIRKYKDKAISVVCESSLEDMDTPEAYQRMLKEFNRQS